MSSSRRSRSACICSSDIVGGFDGSRRKYTVSVPVDSVFIGVRLSGRDEPDTRSAKRVYDRQNPFVDPSKHNPAIFSVVLARYRDFLPMRVQKNPGSVRKRNPVIVKIRCSFRGIPLELQTIWHSPMHCLQLHSSSFSLPVRAVNLFRSGWSPNHQLQNTINVTIKATTKVSARKESIWQT